MIIINGKVSQSYSVLFCNLLHPESRAHINIVCKEKPVLKVTENINKITLISDRNKFLNLALNYQMQEINLTSSIYGFQPMT